ncbi:O-antigen polymerase, partial [Escherichia coli]|nr:O-antigen polymerase [Escherichia coli]
SVLIMCTPLILLHDTLKRLSRNENISYNCDL